jgi:hypothetical protein
MDYSIVMFSSYVAVFICRLVCCMFHVLLLRELDDDHFRSKACGSILTNTCKIVESV